MMAEPDPRDHPARPESLDARASKGSRVTQVCPGHRAHQDPREIREWVDGQVSQVLLAPRDLEVRGVCRASKDRTDPLDRQDRAAKLVNPADRESRDKVALWDHQVSPERLEGPADQERGVSQASQELQENEAIVDSPESLVPPDSEAPPEREDHKESPERSEHPVQRVPQEHAEILDCQAAMDFLESVVLPVGRDRKEIEDFQASAVRTASPVPQERSVEKDHLEPKVQCPLSSRRRETEDHPERREMSDRRETQVSWDLQGPLGPSAHQDLPDHQEWLENQASLDQLDNQETAEHQDTPESKVSGENPVCQGLRVAREAEA